MCFVALIHYHHYRYSTAPEIQYENRYKYPNKADSLDDLGENLKHIYRIFNSNTYPLFTTKVEIYWPLMLGGKF